MLNKVILIGNVGGDPDIRSMPSGGRIANFSLATTEYWKDKEGNKKSKTEWHKIAIFSENLINLSEKYIKKGTKLYIEGSLYTRKYTDNSGAEKYTTEIVLKGYDSTMKILDSRNTATESNTQENTESSDYPHIKESEIDDDIPF